MQRNLLLLLPLYVLLGTPAIETMIPPNMQEQECDFDIVWGLSARRGLRRTMEDTHVALSPYGNDRAFFAIYDGHGGKQAAQMAAQVLHERLLQALVENPETARQAILEKAFEQTEECIIQEKSTNSGTTAILALLEKSNLHVAWVGDSRAIVIRGNEVKLATRDHKPDVPEEKERIEKAGGTVGICGVSRVFPSGLAVSRALGDHDIKCRDKGMIIATPEIMQLPLQNNDILISACDGLWDVISNDGAMEIVHSLIKKDMTALKSEYPYTKLAFEFEEECGDESMRIIARVLRDTAVGRGSTDNISVMAVQFKKRDTLKLAEADLLKQCVLP